MDADNGILIAAIPVGLSPGAVAVGAGSVWVANQAGTSVSRIDPGTNRAIEIEVGNAPTAIVVDHGSVWVVVPDSKAVVRIDPNTNKASPPIAIGARPVGITAGNGLLWVTNCEGIAQMAPSTGTIIKTIRVPPGRCTQSRQLGSEGIDGPIAVTKDSAWVTEVYHVKRVDLRTERVTDVTPPQPNAGLFCDIGAAEDAVWMLSCPAERGNAVLPSILFQVDPSSARLLRTFSIQNGTQRGGALAIAGGGVWVLTQRGTVSRIRTLDYSVSQLGQAGRSAGGIAVGAGSLWVSVDAA
jgi:streptogramin lyase